MRRPHEFGSGEGPRFGRERQNEIQHLSHLRTHGQIECCVRSTLGIRIVNSFALEVYVRPSHRAGCFIPLASEQQIADLVALLETRKDAEFLKEKWLEKAQAETWQEMTADQAAKCISFLGGVRKEVTA